MCSNERQADTFTLTSFSPSSVASSQPAKVNAKITNMIKEIYLSLFINIWYA